MRKIKFLFLALLGITIIPTVANAYTLNAFDINDYGNALNYPEKRRFSFCKGDYRVHKPKLGTPDGCYYEYNGYFFHNFGGGPSFYFQPGNVYYGLFPIKSGEGNILYYANYVPKGDYYEQTMRNLVIPSTTAYEYDGIVYDEIYFYTNTFWFRSSVNGDTLQYIGKVKIKNLVVLANPFVSEDNLFFVNFKENKAWGNSLSMQELEKYFLGNFSEEDMRRQKFVSYYSVHTGGNTIFPFILGGGIQDFQGRGAGNGYVYTLEDYVSPNWQSGGGSSQGQTGTNQSLAEYNACYSYYNSIKTYTSYDYNCYKGLLDSAPLTGSYDMVQLLKPWQDIKDWNGEGNIGIQTQDMVCHQLIKLKREYKEQYKEKRDDFLKVSSENFFYPHTMDIKPYCGERPKMDKIEGGLVQSIKNWFESMRDKFNGNSGEPIAVYSGKNYYQLDFDAAIAELQSDYDFCKGFGSFLSPVVGDDTIEAQKQRYCEKYEIKKKELEKIYGPLLGVVNFTGAISKIESGNTNDISLGKKFVGVITEPYYSGMNSIDWISPVCSGPKSDFFNIFLYLFFFFAIFYIFKLLS